MQEWFEEPKVITNGEENHIVIHNNLLPGPILCSPAHMHDYIEILYCISGTHEILLNWKSFIFGPGDMVLINSREIHQIRAISSEFSNYIVVRFEPEILYGAYPNTFEIKYLLPLIISENTPQKVFNSEILSATFLPEIFTELLNDYVQKPYCFEFALRTNICRIFLWILQYWNKTGIIINTSNENSGLLEQFKVVLDYVNKNYEQDISVAQMAKLCNMSYSYFSRMFKSVMRQGFREYLNCIRIKKSELLLFKTDLSITEIAIRVGFSSSSYYIQQFKFIKKISPKQFRKKFVLSDFEYSNEIISAQGE